MNDANVLVASLLGDISRGFDMDDNFNPYHRWLGIPPAELPADHYRLLGLVKFEDDLDVIRDASERQIAHVRKKALGQYQDLSQKVLNELAGARSCLLNAADKKSYDEQLRARLAPPKVPKVMPIAKPIPSRTPAPPPPFPNAKPAAVEMPFPQLVNKDTPKKGSPRKKASLFLQFPLPKIDLSSRTTQLTLAGGGGAVLLILVMFVVYLVGFIGSGTRKNEDENKDKFAKVDGNSLKTDQNGKEVAKVKIPKHDSVDVKKNGNKGEADKPVVTPTPPSVPDLPMPPPFAVPFKDASPTLPIATQPTTSGLANWLQSLETAKRHAKEQKKDIFLVFSGSDWAQPSIKMANEIFSKDKFLEYAKQRFVLVIVDSPRTQVGFNALVDQAQNQFLFRQFGIEHVPTIFLMDAYGKPYSVHSEQKKSVDEYIDDLTTQLTFHPLRDSLIVKMDQGQTWFDRLVVAEELYEFLRKQSVPRAVSVSRGTEQAISNRRDLGLARFYPELTANFLKIARKADEKNEKGKLELFFETDWRTRLDKEIDNRLQEEIIKELDDFSQQYSFLDQDRAASLYLMAAMRMQKLQQENDVRHYLERAVQFKPQDKALADSLQAIRNFLQSNKGK